MTKLTTVKYIAVNYKVLILYTYLLI